MRDEGLAATGRIERLAFIDLVKEIVDLLRVEASASKLRIDSEGDVPFGKPNAKSDRQGGCFWYGSRSPVGKGDRRKARRDRSVASN